MFVRAVNVVVSNVSAGEPVPTLAQSWQSAEVGAAPDSSHTWAEMLRPAAVIVPMDRYAALVAPEAEAVAPVSVE
jgi:hypothetical protein